MKKPGKRPKKSWREHSNASLRCLRDEIEGDRPVSSREFWPALRLRMAIGAARVCSQRTCRRADICMKPVMECEHKPHADAYDWDYGFLQCARKDFYGVSESAWQFPAPAKPKAGEGA
jgi:hypothetical protein